MKSIEKFKCGEPAGHNHAPRYRLSEYKKKVILLFRWPFGRGRLGANAECCQMLPYFCLWTVFLYLLDVGLNVGLPKKRVVVM